MLFYGKHLTDSKGTNKRMVTFKTAVLLVTLFLKYFSAKSNQMYLSHKLT